MKIFRLKSLEEITAPSVIDLLSYATPAEAVVCGDSTPFRKPHPEPLRHACAQMGRPVHANLHIGDSRHDIEVARAAGCAVYCVPYGYNGGEAVRAADCDALVDNLEAALRAAQGCREAA